MDDNQRVMQIFQAHREINKAFFQLLLKAANQHNITPVQLVVLGKLAEHPNMRLSDLSDRMSLGNSTTSGIIDRMVKAGFVSRERTESDRRAITLNLTDKGVELRKATEATRMTLLHPLLQLSEPDQREWLRIQQDIIRIIKQV
ncbi:MarR family winged helix-turn-helix transcriptional regulator [Cohnella yongneupensis]|uniref:MarR family winged helix-turn-helix transcriptional regulator n=1 Tax=Cohnella yongneupensis TaxID=425006 RepID=A0ABW0R0U1_9BACL